MILRGEWIQGIIASWVQMENKMLKYNRFLQNYLQASSRCNSGLSPSAEQKWQSHTRGPCLSSYLCSSLYQVSQTHFGICTHRKEHVFSHEYFISGFPQDFHMPRETTPSCKSPDFISSSMALLHRMLCSHQQPIQYPRIC